MNLKERARQLKADIPAIYLSLKDSRTPLLPKILSAIIIVYALSPIDLIPDFIPFLGLLDDLLILPLLITLVIKLIPHDIWLEHKANALKEIDLKNKWFYSIPIILVWILIIYLLFKAFI